MQAEIDLCQTLTINPCEFRVVLLALLQRFLGFFPSRPLLSISQFHDPPVVESSAFPLHELQCLRIVRGDLQPNLFTEQHTGVLHYLVLLLRDMLPGDRAEAMTPPTHTSVPGSLVQLRAPVV